MAKSQVVDLEDRRLSPFVQCVIYVKKLQKVIGDHQIQAPFHETSDCCSTLHQSQDQADQAGI